MFVYKVMTSKDPQRPSKSCRAGQEQRQRRPEKQCKANRCKSSAHCWLFLTSSSVCLDETASHMCASGRHPLIRQLPEKHHIAQPSLQRNQRFPLQGGAVLVALRALEPLPLVGLMSSKQSIFAYQLGVGYDRHLMGRG